jgi:two-component system chemotaxis response regulator CheB
VPEALAERPDLVVIGASAGGVEALKRLIARLPPDLPATVLLTLHLGEGTPSLLPGILARAGEIRVLPATEGAPLVPGVVYVSQPNVHLAVVDDHVVLGPGAKENGHRPSVDVLLRSAAVAHGRRVVGVILTGMLDDGTAGLAAVARYGGVPLVQDPAEADFPSMPMNALRGTPTARSLALDALVDEVVHVVSGDSPSPGSMPEVPESVRERDRAEVRSALGRQPVLHDGGRIGRPSPYSCPDCGGVLNEVEDDAPLRFRCRVGHAYNGESLLRRQGHTFEDALWTALRAVEERVEVSRRLAEEAARSGRDWSHAHFARRAQDASRSAEVLRDVLAQHREAGAADGVEVADDAGPAGREGAEPAHGHDAPQLSTARLPGLPGLPAPSDRGA